MQVFFWVAGTPFSYYFVTVLKLKCLSWHFVVTLPWWEKSNLFKIILLSDEMFIFSSKFNFFTKFGTPILDRSSNMWQYFEVKEEKQLAPWGTSYEDCALSNWTDSKWGKGCRRYIWQAVSRFVTLWTVRGRFHQALVEWAFHQRVICNHKCMVLATCVALWPEISVIASFLGNRWHAVARFWLCWGWEGGFATL